MGLMPETESDDPIVPVPQDAMMRVTDIFSYNNGVETLQAEFMDEFEEIVTVIEQNRAKETFVKESSESSKEHKLLASPGVMNHNILIEGLHDEMGWSVDHASGRNWRDLEKIGKETRSIGDEECKLDIQPTERWGKRTIDAMKNGVGLEVQFGKYAFMVYDVLGKFGHFQRAGRLDIGIELLPSNNLVQDMSTGVGYYEQMKTELQHLPEGYIADDHRVPVVAIGVGFERPSVDIDNLEEEAEHFEQAKLGKY